MRVGFERQLHELGDRFRRAGRRLFRWYLLTVP